MYILRMNFKPLFFSLILFSSCTIQKELVYDDLQPRAVPQKTWTYPEAKSMYDSFPEQAKQMLSERNMQWSDPMLQCDPESSFFPFLEEGILALEKKVGYPKEARYNRENGIVRVIYTIDSLGVPGDYRVMQNPSRSLSRAVLEALDDSFYVPGFCNGQPTAVVHNYSFVFQAFIISR